MLRVKSYNRTLALYNSPTHINFIAQISTPTNTEQKYSALFMMIINYGSVGVAVLVGVGVSVTVGEWNTVGDTHVLVFPIGLVGVRSAEPASR